MQAAAGNRTYTFPGLPAGTYYVSYSMTGAMSVAAAQLICQVNSTGSALDEAQSYGSTFGGGFSRTSSSAIVSMTATGQFACSTTGGTFTISTSSQSSVSFIPIDTLIAGTPTGARPAPEPAAEAAR